MDAKSLRLAAFFRAQGNSWEHISKKLNVPVETLEILPAIETAEWEKHMQEFTAQILRDAMLEAMVSLRVQVKSANEKVRQTAALALTKYQMEEKKLALKREALLAQEAKAKSKAKSLVLDEPPPPAKPEPAPIPVEETITLDIEAEFNAFLAANPFPAQPPVNSGSKKLTSFLGGQ
ncbi:MAG: hypothetical protein ACRC8S_14260 [Fimbriiglobus sp.]